MKMWYELITSEWERAAIWTWIKIDQRQQVFLSLKAIQKGKALHTTTRSHAKQSPNRAVKDENVSVEQCEWVTEAETPLAKV